MKHFSEGQWIQWTTEYQVKRGQVVTVSGPSIVVRWLGGGEQVFPVIEYADYGGGRLDVIERPKEASRIERERKRGVMSVSRAAATLGTSPKRVRAMLRSGQLQGSQEGGKWTSVNL